MRILLSIVLLQVIYGVYASDTDLLSVVTAQPSLTKFTSLLQDYPALLAAAQAGHTTILAPNDDAFSTFFATPSSIGNYSSPDELYALMQYHILNGTHASYSITSVPTFIPTLLTNSSYTNVTTGQVVEAVANQSAVTFRSAVHHVSTIVDSDLIFVGGFVHIVDQVMVPPLNALATITDYPLTYFIQSMAVVLTGDFVQTVDSFTNIPNQTYFIANNETEARTSADNPQSYTLANVTSYLKAFTIPGEVVYSTDLTNGSKWRNWAETDLTIYNIDGDFYVNDAKIIVKDILIANGVLHVVSKHLEPTDPDARPWINNTAVSQASDATNNSHGLSTGAKAGIGVGVALAVLTLIALALFFIRKRRASGPTDKHEKGHVLEHGDTHIHESHNIPVHEKDSRKVPHELVTKHYDAAELDSRSRAQELDSGANKHHVTTSNTEGSSS